jgi:two-component system sensor histidine kinase VanS
VKAESPKRGIFTKVFGYTLIFLVLLIALAAALFAQQFLSFYRSGQTQQLSNAFQPLLDRLIGKGPGEIALIAGDFYEKNQSFRFSIEDQEGRTIYATPPGAGPDMDEAGLGQRIMFHLDRGDTRFTLRGVSSLPVTVNYRALLGKILLALALMLAFCVLSALVFARRITRPIMRLAAEVRRMAKREEVPPPARRNDEIGQLARDIYDMYDALKETIARLEREVEREREMEEQQRAFFSAASHELTTPVAAIRALTEGMLSDIGEYRDHRKHLRECLGLLDAQNRLVSEILEIEKLAENRGAPRFEKLDPAELCAALIAEHGPIAEQRRQRILPELSAPPVRADRRLLGRVLSNVLSNALRNSPEGETIRIWDEQREPALLRLCVFNPGARLEGRGGLGLTIVKRALEAMEIPYALQNSDGGVLFWMDLPRVIP